MSALKAADVGLDSKPNDQNAEAQQNYGRSRSKLLSGLKLIYTWICIILLFANYFLAQYDKFVLSYFQQPLIRTLNLSSTEYGLLSGYSTGIVYATAAIPIAYLADTFKNARVWFLSIAALWWSLCVIFQSLSHNFWQIFLARIGMGLGQSCVEPLSISLISDLSGGWRNVFIGESFFYVGVYIGEAISGQIATLFEDNNEGWRIALRAIGITGLVVATLVRLIIHDRDRIPGIVVDDKIYERSDLTSSHWQAATSRLKITLSYLVRLRSFWLLLFSSSTRQLAGNVFGYYMPGYLSNTYPNEPKLLSRYGIIVGTVGTAAVLSGGGITSWLWPKVKTTPLWITGIGGMISSIFVLLMLFSRNIAGGNQDRGLQVLYGSMSAAYATAELWLGSLNGLIASLLPPKHKTFGLAIWASIQVLVYSSGPQIIGLALKDTDPGSAKYTKESQVLLAVMIPVCYWIAGIGFVLTLPLLKRDFEIGIDMETDISSRRRLLLGICISLLISLVIALFVASIYYATI